MRKQDPERKSPDRIRLPSSNFILEGLRNLTNRLLTNVNVEFYGTQNLENIDSPIIFAVAPHNGHMDSLFARRAIGEASREAMHDSIFLAAGDYWNKQPRKMMGNLAVRSVAISRTNTNQIQADKVRTEQIIRQGNNIVIFPEGTRSRDPKKPIKERKFKTGMTQLAIATRDLNTVIVPIYMEGTQQIMPPGSSRPKFRNKRGEEKFLVKITIGKPIKIANQVPQNFDSFSGKEQYILIKQLTAMVKEYMLVQENFLSSEPEPIAEY